MPALQYIHPMIVHFPIVLILVVFVHDLVSMAAGRPLGMTSAVVAIVAGGFAIVSAMLGDAAAEIAVDNGVAQSVIEPHESLGMATAAAFALLALWRLIALFRNTELTGTRRSVTLGVEGLVVVLVLVTAGFGGDLVYKRGVNVATAASAATDQANNN